MYDFKDHIQDALGHEPDCWQTYIPSENMPLQEWYATVVFLGELIGDEFENPFFEFSDSEVTDYADRPLCDLSLLIDFKLRGPAPVIALGWDTRPS
ncbi:MAG: hypothetical protein AAGL24_23085 [Pseudomonadota bacterium]